MKISKSKLRQIIKEELGSAIEPEDGWPTPDYPRGRTWPLRKTVPVGEEPPPGYEPEDFLARQHGHPEGSPPRPGLEEAENEKGRAKQAHDLTKSAPPGTLLKAAAALILDSAATVTIRNFVFDLVKDLDDEAFNDFEEALTMAVDPWGERPRVTSTGPWAPEK